ncbi:hypothetical protein KO465_05975 [Candidatus Micrarchaeota archaeon]|nr:hypothetical protein [Candidatus Micrarchaeota archaeon]
MAEEPTVFYNVQTGRNNLGATGDNVWIIRKNGKKIKIPNMKTISKKWSDFHKTKDRKPLDDFNAKFPKVEDGDIIRTGPGSTARIYSSYNPDKGNSKQGSSSVTKSLFIGPNSEAAICGVESWNRIDKKSKTRYYGESLKRFEVNKGFFCGGYSNCDEFIKTPVAVIRFSGPGGWGVFDLYNGALYSSPHGTESFGKKGTVEYTTLKTKKSYTAKSNTPEEIIVSGGSIFRKGLTKMDPIFNNLNFQLALIMENTSSQFDPSMIEENIKGMKDSGANLESAMSSMEMLKNMAPEDFERIAKMAVEKGGANITPEMLAKMKMIPAMMKDMEKKGALEQMKKATAMSKAHVEGIGEENIDKLAGLYGDSQRKYNEYLDELSKTMKILEKPREYGPLTSEFKVA